MERRNLLYIIIGLAAVIAVVGIILGYPKAVVPEPEADAQTSATLWMNPAAIVVPGDNPLWFEFNDEGPVLIASPEEASLRSFLPWPHSVHIQDMLIDEDRLVMAVNRLGFLVIIPWDAFRLGMYSVSDKENWSQYNISSFFSYHKTPSLLLYRDDFFINNEDVPLPEMPLVSLVKGSVKPMEAEIPAFKDFPSSEGWDIEALDTGKNGAWYFIAAQKSSDTRGKLYYQTESLDAEPSSITMGDYWLAMEPESLRNAPLLLKTIAEKAINARSEHHSYLIEEVSPNIEYKNLYSKVSGESDMHSLFIYTEKDKALALFSDGSGEAGRKTADASITSSMFNLPKLPADFFYTGIVLLNNTIIASWEEQQSYGIGAAGFVLINAPF